MSGCVLFRALYGDYVITKHDKKASCIYIVRHKFGYVLHNGTFYGNMATSITT
jgi:hypothetical protein